MLLQNFLRVLGSSDPRDGGRNLTHEESREAFRTILDGSESEVLVAAFLVAMRWKGVTVEELTGFAQAARERASLPCQGMSGLVCVCPPHDGYDTVPPLEVAAGFMAAAAGIRVLVVSERCVPPRRGVTAASALENLGCPMSWDPSEAEDKVDRYGFAAVAASGLLPALLGLRRVRGDIGVRTPLSTVEKLIVPSSAAVVLGAQHGPVLGKAVETMAGLGHPSGIAIQGLDGGVIPSLKRRTRGVELTGEHQVPLTVEPGDFGLAMDETPALPMYGPPDSGQGTGDNPHLVQASGEIVERVLQGEEGPARNAALLGAAVILKAGGRCMTLAEGVDAAAESLDSGAANDVLKRCRG
jgi:anthranilate phosphoribosyltransferase